MRHDEIEVPVGQHGDGIRPPPSTSDSRSLGDLFKQLTSDTGELIREEATLAKAEMREIGATAARDGAKVGAAAGLALAGALSLTAFLVLGLGNLLGGAYWLSALIIGVLALGIGWWMVRSATHDLKAHGLTPTQTVATLREDKRWASRQARELERELTIDPTSHPTVPPTTRR